MSAMRMKNLFYRVRHTLNNLLNTSSSKPSDESTKGLADAINTSHLPDIVPEKNKKAASTIYHTLIILYFCFGIGSVASAVGSRSSPSIHYSKSTDKTVFKSPIWTFCLPASLNETSIFLNATCMVRGRFQDDRECDFKNEKMISAKNEICAVVEINEDLHMMGRAVILSIAVNSTEDVIPTTPFYFRYLSDFKPTNGINWFEENRPFEYEIYKYGFAGDIEVTKVLQSLLNPFWGGLRISPSKEVLYHTALKDKLVYEENNLLFSIRARQGIEHLDEIDPVDVYSIIGSIAGLSSYVAIFFLFFYQKSIRKYMRELESNKIEEKIRKNNLKMESRMNEKIDEKMVRCIESQIEARIKVNNHQMEEMTKTVFEEMFAKYQKDKNF